MDENDEPYKIYVSCSIGASFFPKDGSSVETHGKGRQGAVQSKEQRKVKLPDRTVGLINHDPEPAATLLRQKCLRTIISSSNLIAYNLIFHKYHTTFLSFSLNRGGTINEYNGI